MYIYIYSTKAMKAKLVKNEMKFTKWVEFLDKMWDDGCQITKVDAETFQKSNGKHFLRDSTFNSLYDKLF